MREVQVGILMGSDSDWPVMREAVMVLKELGIGCEALVLSAHRVPERVAAYARGAAERGLKIIICGAGCAAHLAGAVAAQTSLPVVGVPLAASELNGVDALYATVQMPPGIPVATMAIGKAGARNAGIFAAQVVALADEAVRERLAAFRSRMKEAVAEKSQKIEEEARKILEAS